MFPAKLLSQNYLHVEFPIENITISRKIALEILKKRLQTEFGNNFLWKTLGILENDIEELRKCNREVFPLENIRDLRKFTLKKT